MRQLATALAALLAASAGAGEAAARELGWDRPELSVYSWREWTNWFVWEAAGGVLGGGTLDGRSARAGATLRGGTRACASNHESWDKDGTWGFVFGHCWGVDLRLHALFDAGRAPGDGGWLVALGGALTGESFVGRTQDSASRKSQDSASHRTLLRAPSLLGVALPEAGAAFRAGSAASAYLAWSLPFTVLLAEHVALAVEPKVWFFFSTPEGNPESMGTLGLSVVFR